MVVVEANVVKACPKGANLAEQVAGKKVKVQTSTGEATTTEWLSLYVEGKPFTLSLPVTAPIALTPGDLVLVEGAEYIIWKVMRGDKVEYENKGITDNLAAGERERAARQQFLRAVNGGR